MAPKKSQSAKEPKKDRMYIEAVARSLRILEAFSATPEPQTLSQLAISAGIDKSAAQRMAHTLGKLGYLEQGNGGFVPGRRLLERSFDYLRTNPLVGRSIPILTELRRNVKERVDLSLFSDLSMLYLVRLQSKRDTFFAHLIGRRVPTFCTSGGRAVLAALPDEEVLDILARSDRRKLTPRTTTEIDEILEQVARVRDTGYSLAIEQVQIGELAVGVAVTDKQGVPIGAIHVAGSLSEWEPENFEKRVAPLVVAAATAINSG
jgi:IclR family pca regulon transcriptional regulator